jgi:hypothetical protein
MSTENQKLMNFRKGIQHKETIKKGRPINQTPKNKYPTQRKENK